MVLAAAAGTGGMLLRQQGNTLLKRNQQRLQELKPIICSISFYQQLKQKIDTLSKLMNPESEGSSEGF